MSSASTDRSISSGLSFPQWMKIKIGDRYDLEQATFSPPNEDDSFFFIPYPLSSKAKSENTVDVNSMKQTNNLLTDTSTEGKMKRSSTVPDSQLKSMETQDNSGRSMVSIAQNMITGKIFGNYLSTDKNSEEFVYKNRQRRNSKSLPASPLSSPKICRKNPYFTDPFARPDENFQPGKSGLILSILSQRKSLEDLAGDSYSSASETNSPKIPRHTAKFLSEPKPKPSELREMNFWSPVSM